MRTKLAALLLAVLLLTGCVPSVSYTHLDVYKRQVQAFNAHLPPDIRALEIWPVAENFHARYAAHAKTYRYYILNARVDEMCIRDSLMGMGRVLVRVSGTEPKIHVMVEGEDQEAIKSSADRIADMIKQRILDK